MANPENTIHDTRWAPVDDDEIPDNLLPAIEAADSILAETCAGSAVIHGSDDTGALTVLVAVADLEDRHVAFVWHREPGADDHETCFAVRNVEADR